jgi:hypothetical protein
MFIQICVIVINLCNYQRGDEKMGENFFLNLRKILSSSMVFCVLISQLQAYSYKYRVAQNNQYLVLDSGKITESYKGLTNDEIILIQDLHCDPIVQKNIYNVLNNLGKQYKDKKMVLGIEGSPYVKINTTLFSKIPNENVKNKVIDYFLQNADITGAEKYAILNYKNISLYGIENYDEYIKNFKSLCESEKYNLLMKDICCKMRQIIKSLKPVIYQDEIIESDNYDYLYSINKISFDICLDYYVKKAHSFDINISKEFPAIWLYKKINFNKNYSKFDNYNKEIQLMEEFKKFKYFVKIKIKNDDTKAIVKAEYYLNIFENVMTHSATRDDVYLWENKSKEILDFLFNFNKRMYVKNYFEIYKKEIQEQKVIIDAFYLQAEKRNEIMVNNILNLKGDVKILVSGGYHTQGIAKILRSKGITYKIIFPNVGKITNNKFYEMRLKEQGQVLFGNKISISNISKTFLMFMSRLLENGLESHFAQNVFEKIIEVYKEQHISEGEIFEYLNLLSANNIDVKLSPSIIHITFHNHIKKNKFINYIYQGVKFILAIPDNYNTKSVYSSSYYPVDVNNKSSLHNVAVNENPFLISDINLDAISFVNNFFTFKDGKNGKVLFHSFINVLDEKAMSFFKTSQFFEVGLRMDSNKNIGGFTWIKTEYYIDNTKPEFTFTGNSEQKEKLNEIQNKSTKRIEYYKSANGKEIQLINLKGSQGWLPMRMLLIKLTKKSNDNENILFGLSNAGTNVVGTRESIYLLENGGSSFLGFSTYFKSVEKYDDNGSLKVRLGGDRTQEVMLKDSLNSNFFSTIKCMSGDKGEEHTFFEKKYEWDINGRLISAKLIETNALPRSINIILPKNGEQFNRIETYTTHDGLLYIDIYDNQQFLKFRFIIYPKKIITYTLNNENKTAYLIYGYNCENHWRLFEQYKNSKITINFVHQTQEGKWQINSVYTDGKNIEPFSTIKELWEWWISFNKFYYYEQTGFMNILRGIDIYPDIEKKCAQISGKDIGKAENIYLGMQTCIPKIVWDTLDENHKLITIDYDKNKKTFTAIILNTATNVLEEIKGNIKEDLKYQPYNHKRSIEKYLSDNIDETIKQMDDLIKEIHEIDPVLLKKINECKNRYKEKEFQVREILQLSKINYELKQYILMLKRIKYRVVEEFRARARTTSISPESHSYEPLFPKSSIKASSQTRKNSISPQTRTRSRSGSIDYGDKKVVARSAEEPVKVKKNKGESVSISDPNKKEKSNEEEQNHRKKLQKKRFKRTSSTGHIDKDVILEGNNLSKEDSSLLINAQTQPVNNKIYKEIYISVNDLNEDKLKSTFHILSDTSISRIVLYGDPLDTNSLFLYIDKCLRIRGIHVVWLFGRKTYNNIKQNTQESQRIKTYIRKGLAKAVISSMSGNTVCASGKQLGSQIEIDRLNTLMRLCVMDDKIIDTEILNILGEENKQFVDFCKEDRMYERLFNGLVKKIIINKQNQKCKFVDSPMKVLPNALSVNSPVRNLKSLFEQMAVQESSNNTITTLQNRNQANIKESMNKTQVESNVVAPISDWLLDVVVSTYRLKVVLKSEYAKIIERVFRRVMYILKVNKDFINRIEELFGEEEDNTIKSMYKPFACAV